MSIRNLLCVKLALFQMVSFGKSVLEVAFSVENRFHPHIGALKYGFKFKTPINSDLGRYIQLSKNFSIVLYVNRNEIFTYTKPRKSNIISNILKSIDRFFLRAILLTIELFYGLDVRKDVPFAPNLSKAYHRTKSFHDWKSSQQNETLSMSSILHGHFIMKLMKLCNRAFFDIPSKQFCFFTRI